MFDGCHDKEDEEEETGGGGGSKEGKEGGKEGIPGRAGGGIAQKTFHACDSFPP